MLDAKELRIVKKLLLDKGADKSKNEYVLLDKVCVLLKTSD